MKSILQGEWVKFRSHPLCLASLIVTLLAPGGLAWLLARAASTAGASPAGFGLEACFRGLQLGQAGIVVATAAFFGQEYHNSSLRTTLLATPKRGLLLGAKLVLSAVLAFGACLVAGIIAVVEMSLADDMMSTPQIFASAGQRVLAASVSWLLLSWLSAGLCLVSRSALAAIAVLDALIVGLSELFLLFTKTARFLPDLAAMRLFIPASDGAYLPPLTGVITQGTWAFALLVPGWLLHLRRDVR
ncbi:MAG: ABC transporter permease [Propionibacteriaceae bacterium]|jgi:hypothetical protein|nr:ABC transporter permease [Propionibacteriaceae bacterium]